MANSSDFFLKKHDKDILPPVKTVTKHYLVVHLLLKFSNPLGFFKSQDVTGTSPSPPEWTYNTISQL